MFGLFYVKINSENSQKTCIGDFQKKGYFWLLNTWKYIYHISDKEMYMKTTRMYYFHLSN